MTAMPKPGRIAFIAFVVVCIGWRVAMTLPTLNPEFTDIVFRVGLVPFSDARGWVKGPEQLLAGEAFADVPARRPLYPLFISSLFATCGFDYRDVAILQTLLATALLIVAAVVLQPVRPRLPVLVFLSLLVVWRPESPTVFMTEALGIALLTLAWALLWRGVSAKDEPCTLAGMFVYGLHHAVRPWSLLCLATLPFMALVGADDWRAKGRRFFSLALAGALGFAFNGIAAKMFNGPGEGASYYAETVYGMVVGGQSWMAAARDPEIAKLKLSDPSPRELNRAIYKRAYSKFREDPKPLMHAVGRCYQMYGVWLPRVFTGPRGTALVFIFTVLALIVADRRLLANESTPSTARVAGVAGFCILALLFAYTATLVLLTAIGLIMVICHWSRPLNRFLLLYLLGVLLSIPFVAMDGGPRVRIANDIAMFMLVAFGLTGLIALKLPGRGEVETQYVAWPKDKCLALPPFIAALVLIVLPWMIRQQLAGSRAPVTNFEAAHYQAVQTLPQRPIGPDTIRAWWRKWPAESLEALNGKAAYRELLYLERDAVFWAAGTGIDNPHRLNQLWPMRSLDIDRTIWVRGEAFTLFPRVRPEALRRFDGQPIIVLGHLESRPRRQLYETGAVLIAQVIGYLDDTGNLTWLSLEKLVAP